MRIRASLTVGAVVSLAWIRPDGAAGLASSDHAISACGDSAAISLEPVAPRQGALFRVRLRGVAAQAMLAGEAAGERLHFTRDSAARGDVGALAAAPIDGPDSLDIVVRCVVGERRDSLTGRFSTARGAYPVERLRVAPAFGRAPDSALAERIRRESARAMEVARQSHDTPRIWADPFVQPRESRITSAFGHGREYNGAITSRHMGTDFAGTTGAPVRAANRGIVRIVDQYFYGGNVIYVDHGAGLTSAYLHLSAQLVAVGDTVERGATIGRVGATGRVTGPHLHLIVRYGGVTVDPMSLFRVAGRPAAP